MKSKARVIGVLAGLALIAPATAEAQGPIISRGGTLTDRPAGFPASSAPSRQLTTGSIDLDLEGRKAKATVTLGGEPTAATDADLSILVGNFNGNTCAVDEIVATTPTFGNLAANWTRSGTTYSLDKFFFVGDRDCGVAIVSDPSSPTTTYDVLIGALAPTYGVSQVAIDSVELLEKDQSTLKLVPGAWTELDVTVSNAESATAPAPAIVIGGKGKGLKVKGEALGSTAEFPLEPGRTETGEIMVKLAEQRRGKGRLSPPSRAKKVKLEVTAIPSEGAGASRTIAVKAVKPPLPPVDGSYVDEEENVEFSIKNGQVVGWRGTMQTTCGGFPDIPSITVNTYDFPKVKIPRNGIVDAEDTRDREPDLYGAFLQMRVTGDRVTSGHFDYFGPDRCRAFTDFSAVRSKGKGG